MSNIEKLALSLLSDEHGITDESWEILKHLLEIEELEYILKEVKCNGGRCYLPFNFCENNNINMEED